MGRRWGQGVGFIGSEVHWWEVTVGGGPLASGPTSLEG